MTLDQQMFFTPPPTMADQHGPFLTSLRDGAYGEPPAAVQRLIAADAYLGRVREKVDQRLQEHPRGDFATDLAARLIAGEPVPDDIIDALATQARETDALRTVQNHLAVVATRVSLAWDKAVAECADELLARLRDRLAPLLATIRSAAAELEDLDVTDADAVADAPTSQITALRRMRGLRDGYDELRTLQRRVLAAAGSSSMSRAGASDSTSMRDLFKSRCHEFRVGAPADDTPALWFRLLVERDDVWLPSREDLADAWLALNVRQPAPEPQTKPQLGHGQYVHQGMPRATTTANVAPMGRSIR